MMCYAMTVWAVIMANGNLMVIELVAYTTARRYDVDAVR